jgi:hypothetical protein
VKLPGRLLLALAGLGLMIGAVACGPVRLVRPVSGQVIDRDTKRPVAGAIVSLDRETVCPKFIHGSDHYPLPVRETTTDVDGHFTLRDLSSVAPCLFPFFAHSLRIAAPRYLTAEALDTNLYSTTQQSIRAGVFELTPIRYRAELGLLPRPSTELPAEPRRPAPLWDAALAGLQRSAVSSVGPPAVFVTHPGARFDRVATVKFGVYADNGLRELVVAQDRATGSFHAWTPRGDAVPVAMPAKKDHALIGGRHDQPYVISDRALYIPNTYASSLADLGPDHWYRLPLQVGLPRALTRHGIFLTALEADGRQLAFYDLDLFIDWPFRPRPAGESKRIVPRGTRSVGEILGAPVASAGCMATTGISPNALVFVAEAETRPTVFLVFPSADHLTAWKAERAISQLGGLGAVTACDALNAMAYLALADGRLAALRVTHEPVATQQGHRWHARVVGWAGPLSDSRRFASVAVAELERLRTVVYAVAGDEKIYRFTDDLSPDQRIVVGVSRP